jgi:hypothetical protein
MISSVAINVMKTQKTKIHNINMEFTKVKYGWIDFVIKVADITFKDRFSEVFDPLINYKNWLESIAIGAQQTSFNYDNEGNEIKFDFEQMTYERCEFRITEYYNSKRIFLKANVDRLQLVREFYNSLFSFYFSTSFNRKEWEIEYMSTKIRDFLKVDEEHLINIMINLNRTQMLNLLYFADPVYTSKTKDFNEKLDKNLESVLKTLEIKQIEQKDVPYFWTLSEDYDFWGNQKKTDFINKCLNQPAHGYKGTKIIECKSEIIERYIG